jgi:hypothetical protein
MYGIHSIEYNKLTSYFYLFSALEDGERWLSWDEIKDLSEKFEIPTVPVLYEGKFDNLNDIKNWMDERMNDESNLGNTNPFFII